MRCVMILMLLLVSGGLFAGCITWHDEETGMDRKFVIPTLSMITEGGEGTDYQRSVVFLPLGISKKTGFDPDGVEMDRFMIAPLGTTSENMLAPDGRTEYVFSSIPLLYVSRGWESPDGESYFHKRQCAVILYGSESSSIDGISSRSWYVTPLLLYRRVNDQKELRLFFITIPLSRGESIPPAD